MSARCGEGREWGARCGVGREAGGRAKTGTRTSACSAAPSSQPAGRAVCRTTHPAVLVEAGGKVVVPGGRAPRWAQEGELCCSPGREADPPPDHDPGRRSARAPPVASHRLARRVRRHTGNALVHHVRVVPRPLRVASLGAGTAVAVKVLLVCGSGGTNLVSLDAASHLAHAWSRHAARDLRSGHADGKCRRKMHEKRVTPLPVPVSRVYTTQAAAMV